MAWRRIPASFPASPNASPSNGRSSRWRRERRDEAALVPRRHLHQERRQRLDRRRLTLPCRRRQKRRDRDPRSDSRHRDHTRRQCNNNNSKLISKERQLRPLHRVTFTTRLQKLRILHRVATTITIRPRFPHIVIPASTTATKRRCRLWPPSFPLDLPITAPTRPSLRRKRREPGGEAPL